MAADPSRVAQPLVKSFVVMWADRKFVHNFASDLTASRDGSGPCIHKSCLPTRILHVTVDIATQSGGS
jgi:hypothetical protein